MSTVALVVGAVAAVLQAVTVFKILIVLAPRWSNSRSFMKEWCRELVVQAERWLGRVSGTKKRIKAYRDVQRAILQQSCICFMAAGVFRFIRIQVELSEATDPVYLALDIPVLVGYWTMLTVLLLPCEVSPFVLDTLHAGMQLLCAMAHFFANAEDVEAVAYLTILPRLVSALWVQWGWKALIGHCLCSGVLWWRDLDMVYIAFGSLFFLMTLTCTLHGSISLAAEQSVQLKTKRASMESATTLMSGICDCVIELDASFRLLEDSPQLGTMLFCENSASTLAGSDFLDLVTSEDRERVEDFLTSIPGTSKVSPTTTTRLVDSALTPIKTELYQMSFTGVDGGSCRLIGFKESPDFTGSTVAPLRSDSATLTMASEAAQGQSVNKDYSIVFDAVTFEILVASDDFENLFAKCTGHFADFEKMSIYDLSPDVGATSLSRRIQSAVNSLDSDPPEPQQVLGSFNLFGVCTMKATLELEHDPSLATLVGTLRCKEHREQPVRRIGSKTSSQSSNSKRRERNRRRSLALQRLPTADAASASPAAGPHSAARDERITLEM